MSQIALPLAPGGSGPARIVIGPANAHIAAALAAPETWPYRTAILTGPPRSGKSLLARWFAQNGGSELGGDSLSYIQVALALEDHLGHLPDGWEAMTLGDLEEEAEFQ